MDFWSTGKPSQALSISPLSFQVTPNKWCLRTSLIQACGARTYILAIHLCLCVATLEPIIHWSRSLPSYRLGSSIQSGLDLPVRPTFRRLRNPLRAILRALRVPRPRPTSPANESRDQTSPVNESLTPRRFKRWVSPFIRDYELHGNIQTVRSHGSNPFETVKL